MMFAMIDQLALTYLESDETMTLCGRVKDLATALVPDEPVITEMAHTLQSDADFVGVILRRVLGNSYTQLLVIKDKTRDGLFRGFRDYVQSETNRLEEPARVDQAKTIYDILMKRGLRLYILSYAKESGALKLLFEDLEEASAREALEGIEAVSRLEALKRAQADFEATLRAKAAEDATKTLPQIKDARSKMDRSLMAFLSYLDFQAELKGGAYAELASQVNEVIGDMMTKARARQTLEDKAKEKAKKAKAEAEALEAEEALETAQAEAEALAAEAAEAAARAQALAEVPEEP